MPLYVSARGLTTSLIPLGARILQIEFDFLIDQLTFLTSDSEERRIPLAAGRIFDFHAAALAALGDLDVVVTVDGNPSNADANSARDFWRALMQATRVLEEFRTGFLGKASPTHYFWGVSISPPRAFRGGPRRFIRAASPACPTR